MGLLKKGAKPPAIWDNSKKFKNLRDYVKVYGIVQFLNVYKQNKDRIDEEFKWGDELEYVLVHTPSDRPNEVRLICKPLDFINDIHTAIEQKAEETGDMGMTIHPEFGSYMVELIPREPYNGNTRELLSIESNMKARRTIMNRFLAPDEQLVSFTNFPRLGAPGQFTNPPSKPGGKYMESDYVSDFAISDHPRFGGLAANIRRRRGQKVDIQVPLFIDKNTESPPAKRQKLNETDTSSSCDRQQAKSKTIKMDAMVFGMGMCCQQITYGVRNVEAARNLFDNLLPLTPVMLALSAACPFFKGRVSDWDTRYNVISMCVDDRTAEERGVVPLVTPGTRRILKSRYASMSMYLSNRKENKEEYNDLDINYNKAVFETLVSGGVDEILAKHISHLWIREPLCIYEDLLEMDHEKQKDHFENLNSTNWGSLRFKVPEPERGIGWRIEFRPMDLQLTEFGNAAYNVFVTLLGRAMDKFGTDLYMPVSKIDINMERAHVNDAARTQKLYFRSAIEASPTSDRTVTEQSMAQIVCGSDGKSGLLGIIYRYLDAIGCDQETMVAIERYLDLIRKRARGELLTVAQWMREFVYSHELYTKDSVISEALCRALTDEVQEIVYGKKQALSLLPKYFYTTPALPKKSFKLVGVPDRKALRSDAMKTG